MVVHYVSSKTRDSVRSMETMAFIVRKDGSHDHGVLWHTLIITALHTLVSLQSISPTVSVNCTDLISLMECWPWWVILLSQLLVPVAPPCPTMLPSRTLPCPQGSLLGSFLFSVISLCLLSLSWMNLKRGLWPVALHVKHCYLEHVGNTGMRLSLVILSGVERDKRKSNPCHPSERHQ